MAEDVFRSLDGSSFNYSITSREHEHISRSPGYGDLDADMPFLLHLHRSTQFRIYLKSLYLSHLEVQPKLDKGERRGVLG